jgi:predicted ATP-grasp superfamily ATP-dependent carboligase
MDKTVNVLIFPAGEINAVELHNALSSCVNINLFGGASVDRHGPYIFEQYIIGIPLITAPNFFEAFNAVLEKHAIDVIFPTHDTVASFFADNQERIQAKIMVPDQKTAAICRDKQQMYNLFKDCDFVPRLFTSKYDIEFPMFMKPRVGAGSVGARKVENQEDLHGIDTSEYVMAEYLPGEEYTVDCLTDKNGVLKVVSSRSRDRTLAGITVSGETKPATDEILHIAKTINQSLKFMGLWFFQIKQNTEGQWKLLEVSARVAGTMCLTRAKGLNLPLLSVYVAMGMDVIPIANDFTVKVDRTLINRYKFDYEYNSVYLDFDDTVIVRGKVNLYAIMFIYQCRNQGKKIYLLTRHPNKINATLQCYGIAKELFTDIIQLTFDDFKIDHIKPQRAIFIDNAFQERKLVHDTYHMPVFDVDAIEVLLDWRR